jgi:hypothetical protein
MRKPEFRSRVIALELDMSLDRKAFLEALNELVREFLNSHDED